MDMKVNSITKLIELYTEQLEEYEKMSIYYSAICLGAILFIVCIIIFVLHQRDKRFSQQTIYNEILAVLFLCVPSVVTLYLYTFAMNMRKVALFRGYLAFLDDEWNHEMGAGVMFFDNQIINHYLAADKFLVNGVGPLVMGVFVLLGLSVGVALSLKYAKQTNSSAFWKYYRLAACVLVAVSVLFDGVCIYYLSANDLVVESVAEFCKDLEI